MTWVSVSLRKMTLKNRINNLESQLIDISQRMQTIDEEKSAEQSKINLQNTYELKQAGNKFRAGLALGSIFGSGKTDEDAKEAMRSLFTDADAIEPEELERLRDTYNLSTTQVPTTVTNINDLWDAIGGGGGHVTGDDVMKTMWEGLYDTGSTMVGNFITPGGNSLNILDDYDLASYGAQVEYSDDRLAISSKYQGLSDIASSEADSETQALEAQQEELQAQLKSARAEYDNLGEALDKDIQTSTIKLT